MKKISICSLITPALRPVAGRGLLFGLTLLVAGGLSGCGSGALKFENEKRDELKKIDEFDQKVSIVMPADPTETATEASAPVTAATEAPAGSVSKTSVPSAGAEKPAPSPTPSKAQLRAEKRAAEKAAREAAKLKKAQLKKLPPLPTRRPPDIESAKGFAPLSYTADGRLSRRPLKDPFRVGEKVTHQVHYYSLSAGTMDLEVKPFAQVNGRRNYHFTVEIRTSDWYSRIYSVLDKVSVLMDYETLLPSVFTLAVKETAQLKEARMLFENGQATYWERKVTEKDGEEEKRLNWEILEYSQSVYSTIAYMRFFTWEVGQENAFRVADDNENLIFRGKAIRKEKIKIAAGEFNAIVIQPQVELKGKFKPVGDIFIWLSDDDRKFILKIESKIKIGTLVSEATSIRPGREP